MSNRNVVAMSFGLLLGCHGGSGDASPPTAPTAESTSSAAPTASAPPAASASSTATPKPGAEGSTCGGIAGLQCATGLKCVMTGPMHPDKAGTCQKP